VDSRRDVTECKFTFSPLKGLLLLQQIKSKRQHIIDIVVESSVYLKYTRVRHTVKKKLKFMDRRLRVTKFTTSDTC